MKCILQRQLIVWVLLLLGVFHAAAQIPGLPEKVNFHQPAPTASEVIEALDSQSKYNFSYTKSALSNIRLSQVDFDNLPLDRALGYLEKHAGLKFLVVDNRISVKVDEGRKPAATEPRKGKVTGVVRDTHNNLLPGVTVLVEKGTQGTVTAPDGNYRLELPAGEYVLVFRFMGYKEKKVTDVSIEPGQETSLNVVMEPGNSVDLEGVVVTSRRRENTASLLLDRKNSATMSDGISADLIRRTPDRNAGDAMKRITGASVLDGKYVVVRGLADRYNYTTLNGSLLPSTEPDRRTFSLDLIPSDAIESIVIHKTTTAEFLGEFAGGIVQVKTKDFPETNFFNIAVTSGFYDGVTGKPFMADHKGSKDWIGTDDGGRAIPKELNLTSKQLSGLYAEERFRLSELLSKGWTPQEIGKAAPIQQLQLGYGHTFDFGKNRRLGIIALGRYRRDQTVDRVERYEYPNTEGFKVVRGDTIGLFFRDFPYERDYHDVVNAGGIVNVSYEFKRNKVSFKNIFNRDFDNTTVIKEGQAYDGAAASSANYLSKMKMVDMHLTQKTLMGTQLQGEHRFQEVNSPVLTWNVSYNRVRKYEPGQTRQAYVNRHASRPETPDAYMVETGDIESSSRLFTNLTEDAYNVNFAIATPFTIANQPQLFKAGAYNQFRKRNYYTVNLGYIDAARGLGLGGKTLDFVQPVDSFFSTPNFRPGGLVVATYELPANRYEGAINLASAFVNMESNILKNLKLVYGARVEFFTMNLSTDKKLAMRLPTNGGVGEDQVPVDFIRYTTDLLPSASLVYSPHHTVNIRAAWSKTLARPEFREVSPYQYYDFVTATQTLGNVDLQPTSIRNLDFRTEWFPAAGEVLSASIFRKDLKNPIEMYAQSLPDDPTKTRRSYKNVESALNWGIELEARKSLYFGGGPEWLRNIIVFGNYSRIHSTVKGDINPTTQKRNERPMMGQSPYLVNAGLLINALDNDLTISGAFNRAGRRIVFVGQVLTASGLYDYPDIYENPRNQLDIQVSQRLFQKRLELRINASNLINDPFIQFQDFNGNEKYSGVMFDAVPYRRKSYSQYTFTLSYTFKK